MAAAGSSTLPPQGPTDGNIPSSALATHSTVSKSDSPPFSSYLQLVAFTATITISVSISTSQGFATGGNFFGIPLTNQTDPITTAAVRATTDAANWFSWAAAASSVSLMIALILQLMQTDEAFLNASEGREGGYRRNIPRLAVGASSWIALGLQASSLALMGQALKAINKDSGSMIQVSTTHTNAFRIATDFFSQWALLAVGVPFFSLYLGSIGLLRKLMNMVS